jgi:titin
MSMMRHSSRTGDTMHRAFAVLALGSTLILLGGCDDDPTGPNANAALARNAATDAPSGLGGGPASDTQIDLGWADNSKNESGFELHQSTTGAAGTFTVLVRTAANATSYSNTGLTPATDYCYKIRWFRSQGKSSVSAFSDVFCTRTFGKPPVPQGVVAIPSSHFNVWIDINWTDNSNTAQGYRLERAALAAGPWEPLPGDVAWWVRTRRDEQRPIEVQACYRVTAFNTYGSSEPSSAACTTPPAAPASLVATSTAAQTIDLAWQDKSAAEDGYEVQRSGDGFAYSVVATLPADATTHRDVGLPDNRYFYRLRASKTGGFSSFSNVANALVAGSAPTTSPTIDAVASGSFAVGIYWSTTRVPNIDGYRAERSLDNEVSWVTAGTSGPFQSFFGDHDRTPEQRVCYRVIAFNRVGDAPASNTDCITAAAPVTDLVATPGGNDVVELRWTDPSRVNTGYSLEMLQFSYGYYGGYEYWGQIATIGDVTSHRVGGLNGGQYYQFRLIPLAPDGQGDPSEPAGSLTEHPPAAPTNLGPTTVTSTGVELRWTDNSTDEAAFVITRCDGAPQDCGVTIGFAHIAAVATNVTEYTDTQVEVGATYTYQILAYKNGVTSTPTNAVTVTIPAPQRE